MDIKKVNKVIKINKIIKTDLKMGLKEICPGVFEDNKINFEKLKALLSGEIIEKEDDRFYFNWAGKSNIYKIIQAPAYGTLKPDKERSVDFDNTENIVIVGENLETLKLLLKPYFGKIKMIYIDPPYNTGKDFIYRDNFKEPLKDYLEKTGQIDSEGKKLTTNPETSGRYHSDWLNFMYPRLFLARSLLRDDGVIFISIDDHEVHHLRMIMDEIFGEENFVNIFIVQRRVKSLNIQFEQIKSLNQAFEYLIVYKKTNQFSYTNPFKEASINRKEGYWNSFWNNADRPTMRYEIDGIKIEKGQWKWERERALLALENYKKFMKEVGDEKKLKEYWLKNKDSFFNNTGKPLEFIKTTKTTVKYWVTPSETTIMDTNMMDYYINDDTGKRKYQFDTVKNIDVIKKIIEMVSDKDSLILDFFAGSGTTAHAVWELNKKDGGNRKFILVQLDEPVDEKKDTGKNALSLGLKTVADICIERLRRVSEKYKNDGNLFDNNQDFGFKVFKLDKSSFNLKEEFEFDPDEDKEELKKIYLEKLGMWVNEPLVPDWREIDVIYEVILKEGLRLNSKIEKVKIKDNEFYYVKDEEQNLDFYISLEDKFSPETIEEIRTPKYKGKMFVFLDKALTDNDKINLSAFVRLKVI